MGVSRGKQFENVIRESFEKVSGVSIDRLHDQTSGYLGSKNICDFIVYRKPYEYYIECKTIHGNTFPFTNLTDTQYRGLLEKSKIKGVTAGVVIWYVDKDITIFVPINTIRIWKEQTNMKSIPSNIADKDLDVIKIPSKKKRVFFDYDMEGFLNEVSN